MVFVAKEIPLNPEFSSSSVSSSAFLSYLIEKWFYLVNCKKKLYNFKTKEKKKPPFSTNILPF